MQVKAKIIRNSANGRKKNDRVHVGEAGERKEYKIDTGNYYIIMK